MIEPSIAYAHHVNWMLPNHPIRRRVLHVLPLRFLAPDCWLIGGLTTEQAAVYYQHLVRSAKGQDGVANILSAQGTCLGSEVKPISLAVPKDWSQARKQTPADLFREAAGDRPDRLPGFHVPPVRQGRLALDQREERAVPETCSRSRSAGQRGLRLLGQWLRWSRRCHEPGGGSARVWRHAADRAGPSEAARARQADDLRLSARPPVPMAAAGFPQALPAAICALAGRGPESVRVLNSPHGAWRQS